MIGIAGSKVDPVLVNFAARCLVRRVPFAALDLMDTSRSGEWSLSLPPGPADRLTGAEPVLLDDLSGIYLRPIYLGSSPREGSRWQGLMDGFQAWLDEWPRPVVNRLGSMDTLNGHKPAHQAWLTSWGLQVPPSLLTSNLDRLREFVAAGRAVVKPLSGVRATTRELTPELMRQRADAEGPVLVQRLVMGDDVRVHVIGNEVIACRFSSPAVDYRSDASARRWVEDIPAELATRLVEGTRAQGLVFAGWDFKVDPDGTYWCLECNPMPGYSFYDRVCDGVISDALIRSLTI